MRVCVRVCVCVCVCVFAAYSTTSRHCADLQGHKLSFPHNVNVFVCIILFLGGVYLCVCVIVCACVRVCT